MKPHLPKQLFTTLLAIFTLTTVASGAIVKETAPLYINSTTGEITTEATDGFSATNVTMLTGSASNGMAGSNLTTNAGDTLLGFQLTNTTNTAADSTSWFNGTQTITQDILIYDHDTTDGTKEGLIITNGNSGNVITFAGTVWGNGDFWKRNAPTAHFTFSGDMSKYSGNMTIEGGAITLKFYHNQSGTGTITSTAGTVEVVDATMNNASINAANLKVAGYYTTNSLFSGDVTATNLTIESGATATINGALTLSGSVTLAEAITANGTVTLGSNVVFNISGLSMNKDNTYTLFNGNSTVDLTNCQVVGIAGWTYAGQANGTVLATYNGKTVSWIGDSDDSTIFEWANGTSFSESGEFATNDNVNITGTDKIKLTESVTANQVIVGAEGGTETIATFTDDSLALIVSQGLIIKKGATVEINKLTGGTGFIRGEVTVENGGVLRFNQKDVTGYNGGANSTHTINIHAGGELQLALDESNNNETFAGILNLDGTLKGVTTNNTPTWDFFGGKAVINVSDNAQACTENVNLRLRQDNSTIYVGSNATLTHNGNISRNNDEGNGALYKRGSGNLIVGGNVSITTLNLAAGTMNLQGGATINNVSIEEGTSLTLGKNGATNDTTYTITSLTGAGTGSVLNLESKATLNKLTSVTGSVTVTGSGTYIMGNSVTANLTGWTNSNWTGTVELNGMTVVGNEGTAVHNFGNEDSTIKLSGVSGWLWGDKTTEGYAYKSDLVLVNGTNDFALKITNGSSDNKYNFAGDISGSGDILLDFTGPNNLTYIFSGDISGWTASDENASAPTIERKTHRNNTVIFKGDANDINVSLVNSVDMGTFALEVSTTEAATFNKTVGVTKLSLNQSTTFNDSLVVAKSFACANNATAEKLEGMVSGSGEVSVAAGKTLSLNGAGEEKASTIHKLSAANSSVTLGAGTILTLGNGTTKSTHSIGTLTGGAGSVLNLAAHATLSSISTFDGSVTLSGEGSYHLGNTGALNSAVSLHSTDWKGTLVYSRSARDNNMQSELKTLAAKSSNDTLQISGAAGYLNTGSENALAADIQLENPDGGYALTIVNGNSDKTAYVTGKVSGKGDFVFKPNGGTYDAWDWNEVTYEFQGGVKDWTGNIINQNTTSHSDDVLTFIFSGAATEIYANIINNNVVDAEHGITRAATGDKLAVKISNSKNVNVHGTINADEVTIANSANTSFHSTVNTSKVVLNSAATITKASDDKELAMTNAKLNSTSISSADTTGKTKGSISDADIAIAQLAQDASFTIQDMTLTNTSINAAETTTRVNLNNVSGDATLAKGTFGLQMQAGTPNVGLSGASLSYGVAGTPSLTLGATDAKLVITADPSADVSGIYRDYTLTFNLNVSLDSIPQSGDDWKALVGFDGWLGTMLENQNATYQVADGAAQVAEGNSAPTVSYGYAAGDGGSNVGMLTITINGLNVPEPTTSTLSLLALAALAARRRRK